MQFLLGCSSLACVHEVVRAFASVIVAVVVVARAVLLLTLLLTLLVLQRPARNHSQCGAPLLWCTASSLQ